MEFIDLNEIYQPKASYNPPADNELDGSTEFPNLNSIEYRNRRYDDGLPRLKDFFERIEANADYSTVLLTTNSYNTRVWDGSLYGYTSFDDVGVAGKEVLKLPFNTNINGLRFIDKSMVSYLKIRLKSISKRWRSLLPQIILTTSCGSVQIWSTQSEVRQHGGYSLFQVMKKTEHFGVVKALSLLGRNKAVTGSSDGCMKIWSIEPCDIVSDRTYNYAHGRQINDISTKPDSNTTFCSCSNDRLLSIWDYRETDDNLQRKPLIRTRKNENFDYTACLWNQRDGIDTLYVGDTTGNIEVLDPRNLSECLVNNKLFDRPIHKMKPNASGKLMCVMGATNEIKVVECSRIEANVVYKNSSANDFVRDVCWLPNADEKCSKETLHSVGWNRNVQKHSFDV